MLGEKAERRRSAAAEGKLVLNGKRWNGSDWVADEATTIKDLSFDDASEKYLEFYMGNRRPRSYQRHKTSAVALGAAFSGKRLSQITSFSIEKYKLDLIVLSTLQNLLGGRSWKEQDEMADLTPKQCSALNAMLKAELESRRAT